MEVYYMKQSTRLLSVLLAMIMLFGVLAIGVEAAVRRNAVITKSNVTYDSIDNASLTYEQVATLICDELDALLLDANINEVMDLGLTTITLNLTSLDSAFSSLYNTLNNGLVGSATVGDIADLENTKGLLQSKTRAGIGDAAMLRQFIGFLASNSDVRSTLSKIAYGIENGSDSIDLGLVANFIDTDDFAMLNDIPGMLLGLVFDELLLGSYAYPEEEDVDLYTTTPTVYKEWEDLTTKPFSNIDTVLNTAIYNLLTKPSDKVWVLNETTGLMEKKYDMDSIILPSISAAAVNLNTNTILGLVDNILANGFNNLALAPLNHDLKQLLMEETDVDFVEVKNPSSGLIAAFEAVPNIKNYFVNAATFKYEGNWYFSDYVTRGVDANDDDKTDTDANEVEITEKVRRFFKADASDTDELYELINWDYEFTTSSFDFAAGTATYGSIIGQLNHLLYTILNTVLSDQIKAEILAFNGSPFWTDGANSNISSNLLNVLKFVLCKYTNKFFYKDPAYVDANGVALPSFVSDVKACANLENLVAYIALPLMNDILPELILPKELTDNLEIEQMAALLLREVLSDLTPTLNFDGQIFKAGTLTSAEGREMADKSQTEWKNLVLDMALNLAVVYLDNVTNINLDTAAAQAAFNAAVAQGDPGWKGLLEEIVDWGIGYIGEGSMSILNGFSPSTLGAVKNTYNKNAFTNINKVLNAVLPLSMVCGCSGNGFACDVEKLFSDKLLQGIIDLDLTTILSIFGRSGSADNLLTAQNVVATLLTLVKRILDLVLPGAIPSGTLTNLQTFTAKAGLKTLIANLLASLNTYVYASEGTTGLLYGRLLPLLASFISDWSGEQEIGSPVIEIAKTYSATNGTLSAANITIANGAKGIWRGYDSAGTRVQDEQYKYKITSLTATTTAGTVTPSFTAATLDFGVSQNYSFNATVPTAGAVVLFKIDYQVYNEDNQLMGDGKTFSAREYAYISYNGANHGTMIVLAEGKTSNGGSAYNRIYSPYYVPLESGATVLPTLRTYRFDNSYDTNIIRPKCQITGVTVSPSNLGLGMGLQGLTEMKVDESFDYYKFTVTAATFNANVTSGTAATFAVTGWAQPKDKTGSNGRVTATKNVIVRFYGNEALSNVKSLVNDEIGNVKVAANYNTGTVYANKILRTTAISEDEPKETNFATTGVDPDTGETVTVIDGAAAWATYDAALKAAIRGALQPWTDNSVYNHAELYENLRVATADINRCKKTADQLADEGAENNDVIALNLKNFYTANRDVVQTYKDYMLYRWDRFKEWDNKTLNIINAYDAANAVIDTKVFPYAKINITKLNELLAIDGTYANYINALRNDRTAAQIEASQEEKAKAQDKFSTGYTMLDIEQTQSLLVKTANRLLPREGGLVTNYLATELASALAIYGSAATSTKYSAKSWNLYLERLATAQAELASPTNNQTVFDAKYHLQKAANELILIENGADYSGLEDAIATAEAVLANHTLFQQGQDKVIGLVIAALGYTIDDTNLFPGSAKDVVKTPYDVDDQNRIDDAELKLRLALANIRYSTTTVGGNTGATTENQTETDAYYAFVPANLAIANVYGYLSAVTVPANVTNVLPVTITPNATHAGTGTVVTFYGTLGGISIPVASYSVVVIGDVTGDSAIDSADAMLADFVVNEHREVDGAFLKAALADAATAAGGVVTIAALSAIVNIAVGK